LPAFYTGAPPSFPSYVYNGDMNGDAQTGNDLMYVSFANRRHRAARHHCRRRAAACSRRPAVMRPSTPTYINQDDYQNRRGEYAERNGAEFPCGSTKLI
jgi:hypothetical protein